jgi:hypothetical protein
LNGRRDISHLPFHWQKLVQKVIRMKVRIKFGTTVLDDSLDEDTQFAIEAFQTALDKKEK